MNVTLLRHLLSGCTLGNATLRDGVAWAELRKGGELLDVLFLGPAPDAPAEEGGGGLARLPESYACACDLDDF